jgi:hypothetical protein
MKYMYKYSIEYILCDVNYISMAVARGMCLVVRRLWICRPKWLT